MLELLLYSQFLEYITYDIRIGTGSLCLAHVLCPIRPLAHSYRPTSYIVTVERDAPQRRKQWTMKNQNTYFTQFTLK